MYKKFSSKFFISLLLLVATLFYIALQCPITLKNDLVLANTDYVNIILDNLSYEKLPDYTRSYIKFKNS